MELTKNKIVEMLALSGKVEEMISNITKTPASEDIIDLAQDIYLELLQKPDDLILELHSKGELLYFIVKVITNNIYSQNSPYYYKYMRYNKNRKPLSNEQDKLPDA